MLFGETADPLGQAQLLERGHFGGDDSKGEGRRSALLEAVDAEAGEVGCHVRRVELTLLAEHLKALRRPRSDSLENDLEVGLGERLPAFERAELAVAADDWRQAELEVQVCCTAVDDCFQERVEIHGRATLSIGTARCGP